MNCYNGEYDQYLEVIISSENHETCNNVAKKIRYLCQAWSVKLVENKSARKGDVLKRDIQIYQTSYAHDIITFRESLKCICFHFDLYSKTSVNIISNSVAIKDSRRELLE